MSTHASEVHDLDHVVMADGRIYRIVGNLDHPAKFVGYNVYSPSAYALRGRIAGFRRPPCVRGPVGPGSCALEVYGRGTGGEGGSGYADRPSGFSASIMAFQDARLSLSP
jgi:hypothetical protein